MNWSVLPVAGGLYDQHPQLLDEWMVLFRIQGEKEQADRAKREAELKNTKARARARG